jgi:hypothetical protein
MRWCGLILKQPALWRHTSSMLNREAQMTTAATHVMEMAALRVTSSMPIARSPRPTLGHAGLMPREPNARARSRAVSSAGMDGGTCSCGGQSIAGECGPKQFRGYRSDWGTAFPPNCARLLQNWHFQPVAPLALPRDRRGFRLRTALPPILVRWVYPCGRLRPCGTGQGRAFAFSGAEPQRPARARWRLTAGAEMAIQHGRVGHRGKSHSPRRRGL